MRWTPRAHEDRSSPHEAREFPANKEKARSNSNEDAGGHHRASSVTILDTMWLVRLISRRYRNRGVDHDDLVGAGSVGLVRAVACYDPIRGASFETWASWWIEDAIVAEVRAHGRLIRLPHRAPAWIAQWRRIKDTLASKLGRAPSPDEIGRELEWGPRRIAAVLDSLAVVELRRVHEWDEEAPAANGEVADREELTVLLGKLDDRHAHVLMRHYGLDGRPGQTFHQIGTTVGMSREGVRKMHNRAVAMLVPSAVD